MVITRANINFTIRKILARHHCYSCLCEIDKILAMNHNIIFIEDALHIVIKMPLLLAFLDSKLAAYPGKNS